MPSGAPIPGTVVPTGALASPGGAQGLGGQNAATITSVGFTVPPIGQTVVITVTDASWIVVGSIVYVDQAGGGIGAAGALQVTAKAGNQITLLTPQPPPTLPLADTNRPGLLTQVSGSAGDFVDGTNRCQSFANQVQSVTPTADATQPGLLDQLSGRASDFVDGTNNCQSFKNAVQASPPADATQPGLLNQTSGSTADFVDGTNHCQNLVSAIQPVIWSARLRSYNAVGNATFEVDQRNVGTLLSNSVSNTFVQDRWRMQKTGTMVLSTQQGSQSVVVPGTNFLISAKYLALILTTQETSLAAGDYWIIQQFIEGPMARELANDVSSISLLVYSSVAGLKFGLSLRDGTPAYSISKLCTLGAANTWTLIPLPNIAVFPSGGSFPLTPGVTGYQICICLACGSTFTAPANDIWQTSGAFLGAVGQDNFAAKPINSQFALAFIQHEPGPLCTTLIDKPFMANYDECLRYFYKTYDYEIQPGTVSTPGMMDIMQQGTTVLYGNGPRYTKPMAKTPTITIYNSATAALNSIRLSNGLDYAVSSVNSIGKGGFEGITTATLPAVVAGTTGRFQYTADTGW